MWWQRVIRWLVFGVLVTTMAAGSPDAQTRGFEPADQEEFNRRLENMTLVGRDFAAFDVRINFSTDGIIVENDKVVARAVYVRSDHGAGILSFQMMPGIDPADEVDNCLVLLKFSSRTHGSFVLVPGLFSAEQCMVSDEKVLGTWQIENSKP